MFVVFLFVGDWVSKKDFTKFVERLEIVWQNHLANNI